MVIAPSQDNEMLECITGVDAPKLQTAIMEMLPGGEEEEEAPAAEE